MEALQLEDSRTAAAAAAAAQPQGTTPGYSYETGKGEKSFRVKLLNQSGYLNISI